MEEERRDWYCSGRRLWNNWASWVAPYAARQDTSPPSNRIWRANCRRENPDLRKEVVLWNMIVQVASEVVLSNVAVGGLSPDSHLLAGITYC